MLIPLKGLKLKWAVSIWALIAFIWMALEGNLGLTVLLGLLASLIIIWVLASKFLSGRDLALGKWLLAIGFAGLVFGLGTALMTLILMAIKTGLHAHGPEFSIWEIAWVIDQIPMWTVSGLFAGVGLGLLMKAFAKP